MKSKKAITPVVATIMVILITVVAAFIVVGIISPLISEKLETGSECIDFDNYFYFEEDFGLNCYEVSDPNNIYKISIGAQGLTEEDKENIQGFKLSFSNQQEANAFDVINGDPTEDNDIKMLDPSTQIIEIPSPREVRTYIHETTKQYNRVEVYPILSNNRVCNLADSIDIRGELCE